MSAPDTAHMTPGDAPATAPKPEAPEWLPCPLCGDALEVSGDHIAHFFSDTCPLDQLYMEPRHRAAWNRSAALSAPQSDEAATLQSRLEESELDEAWKDGFNAGFGEAKLADDGTEQRLRAELAEAKAEIALRKEGEA